MMVEDRPKWRTGKLSCIEIPAVDVAASAEFCRRAFGWLAQLEAAAGQEVQNA